MHMISPIRSRKTLILMVGLLGVAGVTGTTAMWRLAEDEADARLREQLETMLRDPRLKTARAGAEVRDARTGKVLFTEWTSWARTIVSPSGVPATAGPGRRMKGDLYLQGTGDPSIRQADYYALAARLASAGHQGDHRGPGGRLHLVRGSAARVRLARRG